MTERGAGGGAAAQRRDNSSNTKYQIRSRIFLTDPSVIRHQVPRDLRRLSYLCNWIFNGNIKLDKINWFNGILVIGIH